MKRSQHHQIIKTLVESDSEAYNQIINRLPASTIKEIVRLLQRLVAKQHKEFKGLSKDNLKTVRALMKQHSSTVKTLLNKHVKTPTKRAILESQGGFIISLMSRILPALLTSFIPQK